ncbi:Hypothetical predicted protein, partial [Pelobates cultripes]
EVQVIHKLHQGPGFTQKPCEKNLYSKTRLMRDKRHNISKKERRLLENLSKDHTIVIRTCD